MIRINLLPHRAAFRQQQIIEYIIVFASAVFVSLALVVSVNIWATQDLVSLQDEYASLKTKNKALSKKIGELRNLDGLRSEVEGKLAIVDELQAGRFRSLVTLEAVANATPQNIWLVDIKDASGSISLKGHAEGSQAIANFMRTLEDTSLLNNVRLIVDKQSKVEGVVVRSFELSVHRLTLAEQEAAEKEKLGGSKK